MAALVPRRLQPQDNELRLSCNLPETNYRVTITRTTVLYLNNLNDPSKILLYFYSYYILFV